MSEIPGERIVTNTVAVEAIHDQTGQEVIVITVDKLELALTKHVSNVRDSDAWQSPAGLFIGVVLVFVTTNFQDALGVTAAVWHAVFLICGGIFLVLFVKSLWQMRNRPTVPDLIEKIKRSTK